MSVDDPTGGSVGERRPRPVVRLPILVVVAGVLIGVGTASAIASSTPVPPPAPAAAAVVAPAGAESSNWYCAGGSGSSGAAPVTMQFLNTSARTVTGTVTSVSPNGATGSAPVSIPAHQQVAMDPVSAASGHWVASRVNLSGGGVAVTQVAHGSAGWSEAPCATVAGTNWYFPTGGTSGGGNTDLTLYNPTAATAVVNLSFLTPSGLQQPPKFQGLVVRPGAVLMEGIGAYVQGQKAVATEVSVPSGRVVADQLEVFRHSGASGLSLELGSLTAARAWTITRSENVSGGQVSLSIMNPGSATATVTVHVQLASGPVAPLSVTVPGTSLAQLSLSSQSRIPDGANYLTRVTETGASGSGIVVGRTVQAPGTGSAADPTWGAGVAGNDILTGGASTWVLPAPGPVTALPVPGAVERALNLAAPTTRRSDAYVLLVTPTGARVVGARVALDAGGSVSIDTGAHPHLPYEVRATAGTTVDEDLGPEAGVGIVTLNALPVASAG